MRRSKRPQKYFYLINKLNDGSLLSSGGQEVFPLCSALENLEMFGLSLLVDCDIYNITAFFIYFEFYRFPARRKIQSHSYGERNII